MKEEIIEILFKRPIDDRQDAEDSANEILALFGVINWVAFNEDEPPKGIEVMASDGENIKFDKWNNHYQCEWDNLPDDYRCWAHKPKPPCL